MADLLSDLRLDEPVMAPQFHLGHTCAHWLGRYRTSDPHQRRGDSDVRWSVVALSNNNLEPCIPAKPRRDTSADSARRLILNWRAERIPQYVVFHGVAGHQF